MEERREFRRFKASWPLELELDGIHPCLKGVVRDIGIGGLRFVLDSAWKSLRGRLVNFSLFFPNCTLKFSGEVMWQKASDDSMETGIRFLGFSDSRRQAIENYIAKNIIVTSS